MGLWLRKFPIAGYVVLTFTISWLVAVPLALHVQRGLATHMPMLIHYLASLGPITAAFALTFLSGRR